MTALTTPKAWTPGDDFFVCTSCGEAFSEDDGEAMQRRHEACDTWLSWDSDTYYRRACALLRPDVEPGEALKQIRAAFAIIGKGEGAFSRDPLEHAGNCIEDMKGQARAALALFRVEVKP